MATRALLVVKAINRQNVCFIDYQLASEVPCKMFGNAHHTSHVSCTPHTHTKMWKVNCLTNLPTTFLHFLFLSFSRSLHPFHLQVGTVTWPENKNMPVPNWHSAVESLEDQQWSNWEMNGWSKGGILLFALDCSNPQSLFSIKHCYGPPVLIMVKPMEARAQVPSTALAWLIQSPTPLCSFGGVR